MNTIHIKHVLVYIEQDAENGYIDSMYHILNTATGETADCYPTIMSELTGTNDGLHQLIIDIGMGDGTENIIFERVGKQFDYDLARNLLLASLFEKPEYRIDSDDEYDDLPF